MPIYMYIYLIYIYIYIYIYTYWFNIYSYNMYSYILCTIMYLRKLHWKVISRYFEYIGHGSPSQSLCANIKHDRWPSQNFCVIPRKFSCSHVVSLFRRKGDVHVCVLRRPQNTDNIFNICPGPHCSSAYLPSHIVSERGLTYLCPMFPFYNPWKHPETKGFLVFLGNINWEHRL